MKWRLVGGLVAVAALGWSAWWFVAAGAREAAIEAWLADRRAEGWQAEVADLDTAGFPNRLDTRLEAPALADPAVGWAWSAPFLDLMTLSYEPNAAILAFPPEQTLAAPGEIAVLRSDGMRASIRVRPGLSLRLTRLSAEAEAPSLEGEGWRAAAGSGEAHMQATEGENAYDLYFGLVDALLPAPLRARVDPEGRLPDSVQTVTFDAEATFDRPVDRTALEDAPPGLLSLDVREAEARWGPLALRVAGALSADAAGFADGSLQVRAENWREMLEAAVAAGALSAELGDVLETGLGLLAAFSGGGSLEAPLVFSGGRMRIGPIPLGPAPRMR